MVEAQIMVWKKNAKIVLLLRKQHRALALRRCLFSRSTAAALDLFIISTLAAGE